MKQKIRLRYFILLTLAVLISILGGCIMRTKPGAPTNLVAAAVAYNQIDLTWQDNHSTQPTISQ